MKYGVKCVICLLLNYDMLIIYEMFLYLLLLNLFLFLNLILNILNR